MTPSRRSSRPVAASAGRSQLSRYDCYFGEAGDGGNAARSAGLARTIRTNALMHATVAAEDMYVH
jgi:hypothetical protein